MGMYVHTFDTQPTHHYHYHSPHEALNVILHVLSLLKTEDVLISSHPDFHRLD